MIMDTLNKYPRASSSLITGAVVSGVLVLLRGNYHKIYGDVRMEDGTLVEPMTNEQIVKVGASSGITLYVARYLIE